MFTCSKEVQTKLTTASTDILGFLFRELLSEFIEIVFIVFPATEHMSSLGNDQIFEIMRLLENENVSSLYEQINSPSLFKFSLFFPAQSCPLEQSKACALF